MKKLTVFVAVLVWLIVPSALAKSVQTPLDYLTAMTHAHRTLNYELLYLLQNGENGEEAQTFRYRHALVDGKAYAQLLRLDDAREEMILRENTVSYFGEFQPFSIQANQILDNLPSLLHTQFDQLKNYHFTDIGRTRVADRISRVIRITPMDDFRYQYTLWIDEENHLLLKSELLDRNNVILEQFRVLQSFVDDQVAYIAEPINSLVLPTLVTTKPPQRDTEQAWQPKWLPSGFQSRSDGKQYLADVMEGEFIESRFYSDGLFSFAIYIAPNGGIAFEEQFWRNGKISLYSQTVGDKDIIVVGEIPLVSVRHIVQEIEQHTTQEASQ